MKIAVSHLLLLLLAIAAPAFAETHRVDDSASVVLTSTVKLKSLSPLARGPQANLIYGELSVIVRLDVSPWKGRQGRIYMTLPEHANGPISAAWTTRGRLMPGILRAGERTLVYAGPIQDNRIEDTLRIRIEADARKLPDNEQLNFSFEIDTTP